MLVLVHKQIVIRRDSFHTVQGTIAIIVELLVHRRPLINLHQTDVGNKEFQFILGQIIDVYKRQLVTFTNKIHGIYIQMY